MKEYEIILTNGKSISIECDLIKPHMSGSLIVEQYTGKSTTNVILGKQHGLKTILILSPRSWYKVIPL